MKKKIYFTLIVIGLLGMNCFFSMNINSTYTCLFHQFFIGEVPDHITHLQNSYIEGEHSHNSPLLNYYLIRFGFLWWGSIGAFVFGLYSITNKFKMSLPTQFQIWR